MGKGAEYEERIRARQAEIARGERQNERSRNNPRPGLRLGPDMLAQALSSSANVGDVLDRLADNSASAVTALRDAESGAAAVVVPVSQYLELVTSFIRDRELIEISTEGHHAGHAAPSDATLRELGVEQVNPHDTWVPLPGYGPSES